MTEINVLEDGGSEPVRVECGDYLKIDHTGQTWFRFVNGHSRYCLVGLENGYYLDSIEMASNSAITLEELAEGTEYLEVEEIDAVVRSKDAEVILTDPETC